MVAVVIAAFWWFSSARATTYRPADGAAPTVTSAAAVPQNLTQLWTAASPKTSAPLLLGATVVTGDGSTMAGLDEHELRVVKRPGAIQSPVVIYRPDQVSFDSHDLGIATIIDQRKDRDILRVELRNLDIFPVDLVNRAIELHVAIGERRLPAKLHILQRVRFEDIRQAIARETCQVI